MKNIGFDQIRITGGFWKRRQDLNKTQTIPAVYDRFYETGRVDAFQCKYKEGDEIRPHVYWDSDVAKWMEAVCMLALTDPEAAEEPMKKVEAVIDDIAASRDENGYYNCYYLTVEKDKRFTDRNNHELYCAGHLMEAAVAHYLATGSRRFLEMMEDYADYIIRVFVEEESASFATPGHQEIELALVKLYSVTGKEKYLALSRRFLSLRGRSNTKDQNCPKTLIVGLQSHKPLSEQWEAEGHAVRACYMYAAMADLARVDGNEAYQRQCKALFNDIVNSKMFITGGVGSNSSGEAFAHKGYLPNVNAYAETCAAIALYFFALRMQELDTDAKYADVIERILYNGALSGVSLDGRRFFYENPLEIRPEENKLKNMHYPITQRVEVFSCSCCPPNICRFIASLGNAFYSVEGKVIYLHQFASSEAKIPLDDGVATIRQSTDYPNDGKLSIRYQGPDATLAVRIPSWCEEYQNEKAKDGYLYLSVKDGQEIELDLKPRVRFWESNPIVTENAGRCAVSYGPLVYCMEEADNGKNLSALRLIPNESSAKAKYNDFFGAPVIRLQAKKRMDSPSLYGAFGSFAEENKEVTLIPYFGFANRGEGEMTVWSRPAVEKYCD